MATSSSSSNCVIGTVGDVVQVPVVHDNMTFETRQSSRLRDMEKRVEAEMRKKKREWEKQVERMREEFLELYPSDRVWGSDESLSEPLVARRRGSTEILDSKKMRTLFLDYPDTGRRYKIRFKVVGFDPKAIKVTTDGERIVVRATKLEEGENGVSVEREYCRKIQKPKEVDHSKLKSYLTSDHVLIIEAPLPPTSLNLRKAIHSPSHSHGSLASSRSRSPSNSPGGGGLDTPSNQKVGVPIFREENGHRRMHLVVEMGSTFRPHDITVQVIKDNRILVKAKHEEKTTERLSKSKFSKEFELGEKIETQSLTGGLGGEGKLVIGAFAKGHGEGFGKQIGSNDNNGGGGGGGGGGAEDGHHNDDELQPCHVLGRGAPAPVASSSQ